MPESRDSSLTYESFFREKRRSSWCARCSCSRSRSQWSQHDPAYPATSWMHRRWQRWWKWACVRSRSRTGTTSCWCRCAECCRHRSTRCGTPRRRWCTFLCQCGWHNALGWRCTRDVPGPWLSFTLVDSASGLEKVDFVGSLTVIVHIIIPQNHIDVLTALVLDKEVGEGGAVRNELGLDSRSRNGVLSVRAGLDALALARSAENWCRLHQKGEKGNWGFHRVFRMMARTLTDRLKTASTRASHLTFSASNLLLIYPSPSRPTAALHHTQTMGNRVRVDISGSACVISKRPKPGTGKPFGLFWCRFYLFTATRHTAFSQSSVPRVYTLHPRFRLFPCLTPGGGDGKGGMEVWFRMFQIGSGVTVIEGKCEPDAYP